MARYILIDANSGYIFGDSADLNGKIFNGTAVEYAHALDESNGEHGREYIEHRRRPMSASGYFVYSDASGSDAVTAVWDGQSRETVDAVERDCIFEGFIEYRDAE